MSNMPWLRLYADMVDNEKVRLLSFDDRWHFVAILCCKQQGMLEEINQLTERKLSVKLGVQLRELDEIKRRLIEVELIDDEWTPIGWQKKQFVREKGDLAASDTGYAYFIGEKNGKSIKIGYSKNPWARLKDLKTATDKDYVILATVKTTKNSEVELHHAFSGEKIKREWYSKSQRISNVINKIVDGDLLTVDDVVSYVETLPATTVATTKDTDTDTDTEKKNKQKEKFTKPTVEQIADYCLERQNGLNPQQVFDHYEANGWMRGKNKIKDWKACVRTWEQNRKPVAANDDDLYGRYYR